jgi:hypothetical protein
VVILQSEYGSARSTSIQNVSGLPQGPTGPSTGSLEVRQTACLLGSVACIMIGEGKRGRRSPCPA